MFMSVNILLVDIVPLGVLGETEVFFCLTKLFPMIENMRDL